MTSKLKADKSVPVLRTGKPLSTETVNRAIAHARRERDSENLGERLRKPSKGAKRPRGRNTNFTERTP
jgi:hypothetical protein